MGRMTLGSITGKPAKPSRRYVIYGPPGVGKTTLAADSPSPVFLPIEEGVEDIDVPRLPKPQSLAEAYEAIDMLKNEKHDYQTLVIDTVTALEGFVLSRLMGETKVGATSVSSVEKWEGGYNKWRQGALDSGWRPLAARLDELRAAKGMHVILVAHSAVKSFKDPDSEGWDRYTLQLEPSAAGFLTGWADAVLFAGFEDLRSSGDKGKGRGVSTGRRWICCEHRATCDAKNRLGLPARLEMPRVRPWAPIQAALDALSPEALHAALAELIPQLPEERREKAMAAAKDPTKLRAVVEYARALVAEQQQSEQQKGA